MFLQYLITFDPTTSIVIIIIIIKEQNLSTEQICFVDLELLLFVTLNMNVCDSVKKEIKKACTANKTSLALTRLSLF